MKEFLNKKELLHSGVVANNRMNRGRGILGSNSYQKDLSFNATDFLGKRLIDKKSAAWLDLCCGEGRALAEAAAVFADLERTESRSLLWRIIGIDLAGMFCQPASKSGSLKLLEISVEDFEPSRKFDLITCVHGLHYIGDKLAVIQKAALWLKPDGIFIANLDLKNLKIIGQDDSGKTFSNFLKGQGFRVDRKRRLLALEGSRRFELPFKFIGADDKAGPNYTGQPAVDSYYKK